MEDLKHKGKEMGGHASSIVQRPLVGDSNGRTPTVFEKVDEPNIINGNRLPDTYRPIPM